MRFWFLTELFTSRSCVNLCPWEQLLGQVQWFDEDNWASICTLSLLSLLAVWNLQASLCMLLNFYAASFLNQSSAMPRKSFVNGDLWLQWICSSAVASGSCSLFFAGFYFLAGGCWVIFAAVWMAFNTCRGTRFICIQLLQILLSTTFSLISWSDYIASTVIYGEMNWITIVYKNLQDQFSYFCGLA